MVNWKNKLLAFLHDPPSKAFDIPNHESLALTLLRQAGFSEEEAHQFSRQRTGPQALPTASRFLLRNRAGCAATLMACETPSTTLWARAGKKER